MRRHVPRRDIFALRSSWYASVAEALWPVKSIPGLSPAASFGDRLKPNMCREARRAQLPGWPGRRNLVRRGVQSR